MRSAEQILEISGLQVLMAQLYLTIGWKVLHQAIQQLFGLKFQIFQQAQIHQTQQQSIFVMEKLERQRRAI
ncbi:hypothetical protein ES708_32451 [subsurface metagenome]